MMVCSSAGMEVAGKSRRKKLPATKYSDGGCGLPELTTRQNPNPLWLLYHVERK